MRKVSQIIKLRVTMKPIYQGFACIVKENKKSNRKYGGAVGSGSSSSGMNQRVHLWIHVYSGKINQKKARRTTFFDCQ